MTMDMPKGQQVKLTRLAFIHGAHERTEANKAMRGVVATTSRARDMVTVLWDGSKTPQRYWHKFVCRANPPPPISG